MADELRVFRVPCDGETAIVVEVPVILHSGVLSYTNLALSVAQARALALDLAAAAEGT